MTAIELLLKYPKATEVVKAWFLEKMIESFTDPEADDTFNKYLRETGMSNERMSTVITLNPRALFDVFDENKIYIEVVPSKSPEEELWAFSTTFGESYNTNFLSRKSAETAAIEEAFSLLEALL